jgi:YVTN family beta-propeller protein
VGASPHHPLITPDGKLGMVVVQGPGTLAFFDPASYTATGSVKVGDMPHWIGLTPDSKFAYVTNENSNDVSVVDLATHQVTTTIPVGNGPRKVVIQPGPAGTTAATPAQPTSGSTGASSATTSAGAPAAAQASAPNGISIANFAFGPSTLTVKAGDEVTFTNNDSVTHTSTSADGTWDSGPLAPGKSYKVTLSTPGTYSFHCSIHPFMTGTVVVQG